MSVTKLRFPGNITLLSPSLWCHSSQPTRTAPPPRRPQGAATVTPDTGKQQQLATTAANGTKVVPATFIVSNLPRRVHTNLQCCFAGDRLVCVFPAKEILSIPLNCNCCVCVCCQLMESPDKSSSYQLQSPGWSSSTLPPSVTRLWRPATQRNLRNQWSKLASYRLQWVSSSSNGRSHATSLVNTYLSLRYIPSMELGVLSDMLDLRKKASSKLLKQQELYRRKLLSSYRDLVAIVTYMVNTSRSMRCYVKGTSSSPLVQFSCSSEDKNDAGDGGGIPVFAFWSISSFEQLADELVLMFISELSLKRALVVELFTISCEALEVNEFCWLNELYPGEFDDLRKCNLFSEDTCGPVPPRLMEGKSDMPPLKFNSQPNHENLQVYLTTWLEELNIDTHRVDEMFAILEEEMHVRLS